MKHVIKYPAEASRFDPSSPLHTIVWDDEAGAVEGDHPMVPGLNKLFELPALDLGGPWGYLVLDDAAHDPRQFLALLIDPETKVDPRAILPDSLKGIEPMPFKSGPLDPDALY